MAIKDIQYKYKNLEVACRTYIRGEVRKEDCPDANEVFYVANIPKGAILKNIIAWSEDSNANGVPITVTIGTNNCLVCTNNITVHDDNSTCVSSCECTILKEDAIVVVKFNDQLPNGRVIVLLDVIMPERTCGCKIPMYDLCRIEVSLEPCLDDGTCCDYGTCGTGCETP